MFTGAQLQAYHEMTDKPEGSIIDHEAMQEVMKNASKIQWNSMTKKICFYNEIQVTFKKRENGWVYFVN